MLNNDDALADRCVNERFPPPFLFAFAAANGHERGAGNTGSSCPGSDDWIITGYSTVGRGRKNGSVCSAARKPKALNRRQFARSRLSGSGECLKQIFCFRLITARHAGGEARSCTDAVRQISKRCG